VPFQSSALTTEIHIPSMSAVQHRVGSSVRAVLIGQRVPGWRPMRRRSSTSVA
jgi:hypothetical protein